MAESKRTFQRAKIDRDIDERLIQPGSYRDALNVSVDFSEDANVGGAENIKGNALLAGQSYSWLDPAQNINVTVIGSIPHPESNKIYYFFTGSVTDGIAEYDLDTGSLKPILLDSTTAVPDVVEVDFTFADANASATVDVGGMISVRADFGVITSITSHFDETTAADQERTVQARVRVPRGYANYNKYVYGTLNPIQPGVGAPSVYINRYAEKTDTTATLTGFLPSNPGLTALGFKYIENSGGSTSYTNYTNKFVIVYTDLYNETAVLSNELDHHFLNIPKSDITVRDKNGTVITESGNWEYTNYTNGQASTLKILNTSLKSLLPITVGQTSTANTITTGSSLANLQSNGTLASISPIVSPFEKNITGLTPDTEYIYQAFATNSDSTVYSNFGLLRTKVATISLPTFSGPTALAGTESVIFKGTPNSNGGDSSTVLYVVSSETSGTLATYKSNAKTILGGGTVSGFTVSAIGTWVSGVQQSTTVSTTGGATRYGLIFAKNSSPTDGGDGAGYVFNTSFNSVTAGVANVNGAATFSGSMTGTTGTVSPGQTLTFTWSGTSTVTTLPVGGHTTMHGQMTGSGLTGITSGVSGSPSSVTTVGGTSSWNTTKTITGPTNPGTYTWRMYVFYDSNTQANGYVTGSITVPTPVPTSGTFTLNQNLTIGPYVGQTYGGSIGSGLLATGNLTSTGISVGDTIRFTYNSGNSTVDINVTSTNFQSSSSSIGYTLGTGGPGGLGFSAGTVMNWSQV